MAKKRASYLCFVEELDWNTNRTRHLAFGACLSSDGQAINIIDLHHCSRENLSLAELRKTFRVL